jgi:hypothetical protein
LFLAFLTLETFTIREATYFIVMAIWANGGALPSAVLQVFQSSFFAVEVAKSIN